MKRIFSWSASVMLCSIGVAIVAGFLPNDFLPIMPVVAVLLLISFSFFAYYDSL